LQRSPQIATPHLLVNIDELRSSRAAMKISHAIRSPLARLVLRSTTSACIGLAALACTADDGDPIASTESSDEDTDSSTETSANSTGSETDETDGTDETDETDETGDESPDPTDGGPGLGETCDTRPHEVPIASSPAGPKLSTTITLPGDATVADVMVSVDLLEVMSADFIEIRLIHAGTTVFLYDQHCGDSTDIQVRFDDAAAPPVCDGGAVTGDAAPFEPLAAFAGLPVAGDWTLDIITPMSFNPNAPYQALLNSWCIDISD
jgi:hypothetical protein